MTKAPPTMSTPGGAALKEIAAWVLIESVEESRRNEINDSTS